MWTSLSFLHEDSCWSAAKTLFAECPNDDGAMKDCSSKPQVGQTVRRSSMKVSMSLFDERHTTSNCGMGEWDLYFFVPSAAFPLITSESQQILLWLWRSKQLFPCCSAAVGCERCVERHYLSVNDATVRLSGQSPLHMDHHLGGSQMWLLNAGLSKRKQRRRPRVSTDLISRVDRDHHDSID